MFHDPDLIDPAHRAFFHSAVRAEAFEVMFADKKFRRLSHRFHIQLDNVARTVMANNKADCHIALHWDSTKTDKGAFYMSVPNVESYRNMEPVKSNWQKHHALGDSLIAGLKGAGVKIFSSGAMEMDLTQTSFSTVPSIDIELGDKASDHSDATLNTLADGLVAGVKNYFGK